MKRPSLTSLKNRLRRLEQAATTYYNAPYRAAIARARREEQDLFMMLVFAEMMGIDNPASWHTLELQPLLLDQFHEWHQRMGMPRSPLDHFRCC